MTAKDCRDLARYRQAEREGKICVADFASGDVVWVVLPLRKGAQGRTFYRIERKVVVKLCFYKDMKEIVFTDGTSEGVPIKKRFHMVFHSEKEAMERIKSIKENGYEHGLGEDDES